MSSLKPTSMKQRGKTFEKKKTQNVKFRIGRREKEYDNEFVFSSRKHASIYKSSVHRSRWIELLKERISRRHY